jgi:phosphoenolpyruvate-protein kinase (PTS system EI component)
LAEERESLLKNGVDIGEPRLGVMVEVPATVLMIDKILDEVDVLCLGTNDLVQYMLAVDRDNEAVAKWFNSLNPAVIRAVKSVLEAAEGKSVSCVVCGEMAGSPFYVPLLIGLGATELSMNPASIPRIRDLISSIRFEDTLLLAREVEDCSTAVEVEQVVGRHHAEKWSDLTGRPKTAG